MLVVMMVKNVLVMMIIKIIMVTVIVLVVEMDVNLEPLFINCNS